MEQTLEQKFISELEYSQKWEVIDKYYSKGSKSYSDVVRDADVCKVIYDAFMASLPAYRSIKSALEIKIGQRYIYTRQPRGTGMFVPNVGDTWDIKTKSDIMSIAIEMIERGRGWKLVMPGKKPTKHPHLLIK